MLHIFQRGYPYISEFLHQTRYVLQSLKYKSLKPRSFGVGLKSEQAIYASSSRSRPISNFWPIRRCISGNTLLGNNNAFTGTEDGKTLSSRYKNRGWSEIKKRTGHSFEHLTKMAEAVAQTSPAAVLEKLNFDNKAMKSLPVDESTDPRVRRQVSGACFTSALQEPVENPETVALSPSALELLEISKAEAAKEQFAEYFSGSKLLPGSKPSAHCYCGHQFGYFSGQLGDGAAMYLGEIINTKGERWELQLKGSGPTPFSRQADGRKVLRSSIREFLCSEAMHFLGIPTTRSGSCVTSDTRVMRDIFYDGNPIMERATVISRIAPSFLRFGSFEIFKPLDNMTSRKGPSVGNKALLHQMLKYSIETLFPEVHEKYPEAGPAQYAEFYKEVVVRTAKLVADWQCVGFCHGVLNTDNMSILGLTIDYGPFGFMDFFNPDHVCNGSDDQGRYSYQNQPSICKWNLQKFAEALQDALPLDLSLEILNMYDNEFKKAYTCKMRQKLGLLHQEQEEDSELITALFDTMKETCADFTNTFRFMSKILVEIESPEKEEEVINYLVSQCKTAEEMKSSLETKSSPQQVQLLLMMIQAQPGLLQQLGGGAVKQLEKELEKMEKMKGLKDLTQTDKNEKDRNLWKKWLEKYRARLQKEFESMEASAKEDARTNRIQMMNNNNPRIVLRNHIAQHVIEAAEEGNFEEVRNLLKLLQSPYSETNEEKEMLNNRETQPKKQDDGEIQAGCVEDFPTESTATSESKLNYLSKAPSWATKLVVT
eukprot:Seg400.8 transcript_id=Seg400.8/GoldUCD/mRNA.D3Y31 product="Selenoprotein O" protein_id=Seg400.8/GoldUCD/D3Y31